MKTKRYTAFTMLENFSSNEAGRIDLSVHLSVLAKGEPEARKKAVEFIEQRYKRKPGYLEVRETKDITISSENFHLR